MEKKLLQFGLTNNEAKIYVTLLKRGSSLAGQITNSTGIHRRNVYDSLERLMQKGLVSEIILDNKKYFEAANPDRLLEYMRTLKEEIDEKTRDLMSIIPDLNKLGDLQNLRQTVAFFKGVEGIKTVFNMIIKEKEDYVGYGPGILVDQIVGVNYVNYFIREIKVNKAKAKLLYHEKNRGKANYNPNLAIKYLVKEFGPKVAYRIFGSKVAILLLEEDNPLAILIDNRSIADSHREYFEILWDSAKE